MILEETIRNDIINEYFEWLYNYVCEGLFPKSESYRKLFMQLHNTEFTFTISRDANRADDGVNMRYRFVISHGHEYEDISDIIMDALDGPCSVLEMILALAIRCEETIMDDPDVGDRTKQWFWGMITNLGLGSMTDRRFDKAYVNQVVERFLNRDYEPDGKGGLFTVRNSDCDLRDIEIWHQLCRYLDTIT